MTATIFDFQFVPGQKALYTFVNEEDKQVILTIIDRIRNGEDIYYVAYGPTKLLEEADLLTNGFLCFHYDSVVPENNTPVYIHADELEHFIPPRSGGLKVVVDNT